MTHGYSCTSVFEFKLKRRVFGDKMSTVSLICVYNRMVSTVVRSVNIRGEEGVRARNVNNLYNKRIQYILYW